MLEHSKYFAIDIVHEYNEFVNLQTIKLNHNQICELFRQIFDVIDKNLKDVVAAINSINFYNIFIDPTKIPKNSIDEIHSVCLLVMVQLYGKLHYFKLLNNYYPDSGFPFFIEAINEHSCYLRILDSHVQVPY